MNAQLLQKDVSLENMSLPRLPHSWSWVRFSSLCDRVSVGHVGPTTKHFVDTGQGVTLVRSQNVRPGKLALEGALQISNDFHSKLKKSQLRPGDVLVVRVGANRADSCVVPKDSGELNCANIVFARPRHNGDFFSYYFQTRFGRKMLLGATTGAAQEVINTASVAGMPVPLPPKPTQRRIADTLGAYHDLIENNRRRIALLEEAARLLYREWFVHFRFPGHEHVKTIDGVPEGWEVSIIEDALVLQRGFDLPVASRNPGEVPVYGSTGVVGFHDTARVGAPMLITGRSGSLGQVSFVSVPSWPLNTSLWVKEFRKVSPWYGYFLLSELGLEKYNGGASVPTLDRKVVHRLPIILPPEQFRSDFDNIVKKQFEMMGKLTTQNVELAKARDLLLPRLMDGRLEV